MSVTVYSTATCPYCVMVKKWLDNEKVHYKEVRVDQDMEAARKMVEISGQMGVPFTTVEKSDGTLYTVLGFDIPRLRTVLKESI